MDAAEEQQVVATGRIDPQLLTESTSAVPPLEMPERPTSEDVDRLRLGTSVYGYATTEVDAALDAQQVDVVAGTAWLFARPELDGKLDLLVIDEAGQRSLADVLAVSGAAVDVVLLGDPQQLAHGLEETATDCSLDYEGGPGMGGWGPFGESSGGVTPIAVENFHMLKQRQTSDRPVDPGDAPRRVNLLNWDGKGVPEGLFPPKRASGGSDKEEEGTS